MFFESLINRGTLPAIEALASFAEQRHRVVAENLANIDTPGYRAKHLDPAPFQKALADALDRRDGDRTKPFELRASHQFRQRADGTLSVTPTLEPGDNVLFHDGTNTRLEYELTALAENGMAYEYATQMLKGRYDGLISAIRGTVG